jgi:polyhydroxyalkanoate synthesis regulator phasin
MNTTKITQEMIAFHKIAYDNSMSRMNTLHEQTEKLINKFWQKSPMFPEEGKKAISDWMTAYKNGYENYKISMDEHFQKVENYFNKDR